MAAVLGVRKSDVSLDKVSMMQLGWWWNELVFSGRSAHCRYQRSWKAGSLKVHKDGPIHVHVQKHTHTHTCTRAPTAGWSNVYLFSLCLPRCRLSEWTLSLSLCMSHLCDGAEILGNKKHL
jgi:hypothetical protein